MISDEEETVAAPEGVAQGLDAMMNGLQEMKRNMDEAVVQQTKRQKVQEPTEVGEATKPSDRVFNSAAVETPGSLSVPCVTCLESQCHQSA